MALWAACCSSRQGQHNVLQASRSHFPLELFELGCFECLCVSVVDFIGLEPGGIGRDGGGQ